MGLIFNGLQKQLYWCHNARLYSISPQKISTYKTTPTYTPYRQLLSYNQIRQIAVQPDTFHPISTSNKTKVQQIIWCLLYYARALDNTMLIALNTIAQSQSNPTQHTAKLCYQLPDYCATYPNVGLKYHKNNMILHIHSDASYLVAPYTKSRISWYFFLSSDPTKPTTQDAPIRFECKTLHRVVTSSGEWETAAVFHNVQIAIHIRYMLQQLGHLQPPTPIILDNGTTEIFKKNNIKQKRSESWDMKYYWLCDKKIQRKFDFIWKKS